MIGLSIVFILGKFEKDQNQLVPPREHEQIENPE